MELTIAKDELNHLLYLTTTIVERKNTMPILANVKLSAENDCLSVAATDLEVSLVGEVEAQVKAAGSITVDAKVLYDIVRELPDESVRVLASRGQRLEIESGQSRFKINGTSAEEFPAVVGTSISNPVSVDAQKFYAMFDKTAFAVSTDETRYNINGVFVETIDGGFGHETGGIRFVATDGHRLAMIDRPADGFSLSKSVIIPRKGINEIKKVLEGNQGAANIGVSEGFFTVESGRVRIGVRLVDGEFPDYRQVIPVTSSTIVEVDRAQFSSAVKRVSLVTTDKTKAIKLKLLEGNLLISSSSPEYGEASESVAVSQEGEDLTIGFSARYLVDVLNSMSATEMVRIKFSGDLGPGVFVGTNDEHYTCIVMPMRFE